ncbi:MAG: hypothetical protein M1834_000427 [Cirrosporium novae-zelandiae]|nr:MAG: hypothetical protein M1834_000427 [Cirrosporium novae-zelandiae]
MTPPLNPLIAIVGATGTGKSQLAVHLSAHLNGEIINADALQLYSGLPLLTNKITIDEQKGVPHHLLGTVGLEEKTWTVGTFRKRALEKCREIWGRGKVPVLVGGTAYYVQNVITGDLLLNKSDRDKDGRGEDEDSEDSAEKWPILEAPTEEILKELEKVDPVMAQQWHPRDRRKIRRSLEIYLKMGRKASEIYEEQRRRKEEAQSQVNVLDDSQDRESAISPILFIPHMPSSILAPHLTTRIHGMLNSGLLDEVSSLSQIHNSLISSGHPPDTSRGIWVAIGYKEFMPYISELIENSQPLNGKGEASPTQDKKLEKIKEEAIESMAAHTRQYSHRQLRWLRHKLLPILSPSLPSYIFPFNSPSLFHENVEIPALSLARLFLSGQSMPLSSNVNALLENSNVDGGKEGEKLKGGKGERIRKECEVCGTVAVWEVDWQKHITSRRHKRSIKGQKRKLESKEWERKRLEGENRLLRDW